MSRQKVVRKDETGFSALIQECKSRSIDIAISILGPPVPSRRAATRWHAPWRADENPSLVYEPGKNAFFDNPSNFGGDIICLVARVRGLDRRRSFREILRICCDSIGIDGPTDRSWAEPVPEGRIDRATRLSEAQSIASAQRLLSERLSLRTATELGCCIDEIDADGKTITVDGSSDIGVDHRSDLATINSAIAVVERDIAERQAEDAAIINRLAMDPLDARTRLISHCLGTTPPCCSDPITHIDRMNDLQVLRFIDQIDRRGITSAIRTVSTQQAKPREHANAPIS